MIAVMYHYVRRHDARLPFFRYLDLDAFRRQLDWIAEHRRFASRADLADALEGKVDADATILTFDDSLLDHHGNVVPELVDRGLWGVFYVPAGPYLTGEVLDVHKTHVLLGRHGGNAVLQALGVVIEPEMMVPVWVEQLRDRTYRSQSNDDATLEVKQVLNYFTQVSARPMLLRRLEEHFGEVVVPGDVYMSEVQLRELHDAGMVLGSHSVSHRPMSQLALDEQASEIRESFGFLEGVAPLPMRTFCYPYGGFETFTADTERLLDEAGCLFSFNVEPRAIACEDVLHRRQALPRFDCNRLPEGEASGG